MSATRMNDPLVQQPRPVGQGVRKTVLAGVLGAALVMSACGSSGSSGAKASAGSTTTAGSATPGRGAEAAPPAVSATPTTYHYFSRSASNEVFHADGSPITARNEAPKVGDYFVSTGEDFSGTHSAHSSTRAGTDHLVCVVESVTGDAGTGLCDGELALGGSMLVVDHQSIQLNSHEPSMTLVITGGTGRFQNVTGLITSHNVTTSNDTDFDVRISRASGAAVGKEPDPKAGVPSVSGTTTLAYFQQSTTNELFGPTGKAITEQNSPPPAGSYVVSADADYVGTHLKHDPQIVGTDHIVCTVGAVTQSSMTAVCDGEFDLGGSIFYADRQTVTFGNAPSVSIDITGGTGAFKGVHGAVKSNEIKDSNDSDVVVTLSK